MSEFRERINFEASLYSVPARAIWPGQRLELRVTAGQVAIHAPVTGELLAAHPRVAVRGSWVVDPAHWDGLPDGHTRARHHRATALLGRSRRCPAAAWPAGCAAVRPRRRSHPSGPSAAVRLCRRRGRFQGESEMSELTANRIRAHAERLGLTQLAGSAGELAGRAEAD